MGAGGSERFSSMGTIALAAVGTVGGVVAGVLVSAWLSFPKDSVLSVAGDDAAAGFVSENVRGPDNARAMAHLEARMAALEGRAAPSSAAVANADGGVKTTSAGDPRPTIEEAKHQVVTMLVELAAEHQREAV